MDRNLVQKTISGAVPALLAGLADVASTPNGARQVANAAIQQPAPPDGLKNLLSNADQKSLADAGSNLLSGLFGGSDANTMAQTISRFAGLNEGSSKTILGVLAPVVLGALGQQQRSGGLDANGLASLLTSQKDQIVATIPSRLADQLSAAGLIGRAASDMRGGVAPAADAVNRVAAASDRTVAAASRATNSAASSTTTAWPYLVAAAAVLAVAGWYYFGNQPTQTVATTAPASQTVGKVADNLTVGGLNLANQVNTSVDTLKSVLPGITDAASAQAALPKLRDAVAKLNDVTSRAAQLSPEGKTALAGLIAAAMPTINQMCDKVLAIPGVGTIAKPSIDELRSNLDTLAHV
jgi:hypothetical protein